MRDYAKYVLEELIPKHAKAKEIYAKIAQGSGDFELTDRARELYAKIVAE
jgi:hypothetical protein